MWTQERYINMGIICKSKHWSYERTVVYFQTLSSLNIEVLCDSHQWRTRCENARTRTSSFVSKLLCSLMTCVYSVGPQSSHLRLNHRLEPSLCSWAAPECSLSARYPANQIHAGPEGETTVIQTCCLYYSALKWLEHVAIMRPVHVIGTILMLFV